MVKELSSSEEAGDEKLDVSTERVDEERWGLDPTVGEEYGED